MMTDWRIFVFLIGGQILRNELSLLVTRNTFVTAEGAVQIRSHSKPLKGAGPHVMLWKYELVDDGKKVSNDD